MSRPVGGHLAPQFVAVMDRPRGVEIATALGEMAGKTCVWG